MSFWQRVKSAFAVLDEGAYEPRVEQKFLYVPDEYNSGPYPERFDSFSATDYAETIERGFNRHYLWYAAVRKKAESVARLPFKFYQRNPDNSRERLSRDNYYVRLFERPNPYQTSFEWWEATVYSLELAGEFFWEIADDELHLLRPDYMDPVIDVKKGIVRWKYSVNGNDFYLPVENVIHGKYYNPLDRYRGLAPVTALRLMMEGDLSAQEYNLNFYGNSSVPSGALQTDEFLEEDDYQRIRGQWEKTHKGSDKSHRVAVLESGLEWQQMTLSQKDAEFIEQQKLGRTAISAVTGVPPMMLGIYEYANYANADAQIRFFNREIISLLTRRLERLINFELPDDIFGEFDFQEVLRPEPKEEAEVMQTRINTGINSRNEARRALNLEPVEGGDELFVPVNSMPLERALADPAPEPERMSAHARVETKAIDDEELDRLRDRFSSALERHYDEEAAKVVAAIGSAAAARELLDADLIDAEDVAKLKAVGETHIREGILYGAKDGELALIEAGISDVEPNRRALQNLPGQVDRFADDVSKTTVKNIRDEIRVGMTNGEDINQISRRVQTYYDDNKKWRANVAARTETATAYSTGTLDTYRLNGIRKKEWSTAGDSRVEPECAVLAGEVRGVDELFSAGVSAPPIHANCRCSLLPVIEE